MEVVAWLRSQAGGRLASPGSGRARAQGPLYPGSTPSTRPLHSTRGSSGGSPPTRYELLLLCQDVRHMTADFRNKHYYHKSDIRTDCCYHFYTSSVKLHFPTSTKQRLISQQKLSWVVWIITICANRNPLKKRGMQNNKFFVEIKDNWLTVFVLQDTRYN